MFKKLHIKASKIPRALRILIIGLMVLAVPVVAVAYGPDRPVFDYNKFDSTKPCTDPANDHGRCGSMTGPVFNSFSNGPGYGDERNFNRISEAADANPVDDNYADNLPAQPGKEYWVRIYVHNNANQTLNCTAAHRITAADGHEDCSQLDAGSPGIATGTTVRLDFDRGRANGHDIKTYVKASNADPVEVYDDAQLNNDSTKFRLEYVPGSAFALTNKQNTVHQPLPDGIDSPAGITIGEDFNGNINGSGGFPGCFDFATRVYVKVVVKAPVIKIVKKAYISGTTNMVDGQTVKPTDNITWKAYVFNIGNDAAIGAIVRDTLPKDNKFTPGALKFYNDTEKGTVQGPEEEDLFFNQGGLDIGDYTPMTDAEKATLNGSDPNTWAYNALFTYKTSIGTDNTVCQMQNQAFARAEGVTEVPATSVVLIDRNGDQPGNGCNEQPPQPSYACDVLELAPGINRTVTISKFQTSQANGATFTNAVINWGDNSAPLTTDSVVGQTHSYASDNTFTVSAVAHFMVNGQDKTATSAACAKPVTFSHENCTVPGKENLPKDSPQCQEYCAVPGKEGLPKNSPECHENCKVPGKEKLPKNSPDCKETPVVVTTATPAKPIVLPNTGPGDVVGIFAAVTVAGAFVHRYILSRR